MQWLHEGPKVTEPKKRHNWEPGERGGRSRPPNSHDADPTISKRSLSHDVTFISVSLCMLQKIVLSGTKDRATHSGLRCCARVDHRFWASQPSPQHCAPSSRPLLVPWVWLPGFLTAGRQHLGFPGTHPRPGLGVRDFCLMTSAEQNPVPAAVPALRPCSCCDKPLSASAAESHVVCRPEESSRKRSPGASGLWVSAGARSSV